MTLSEAAKVLGVDPGTLRVQVHNGKLRARKVGPIWTVTSREVERYRRESLRRTGECGCQCAHHKLEDGHACESGRDWPFELCLECIDFCDQNGRETS